MTKPNKKGAPKRNENRKGRYRGNEKRQVISGTMLRNDLYIYLMALKGSGPLNLAVEACVEAHMEAEEKNKQSLLVDNASSTTKTA